MQVLPLTRNLSIRYRLRVTLSAFEAAARELAHSRGSIETADLYIADLDRWLSFCVDEKVDATAPSLAAAVKFRDLLKAKFADPTIRRILAALSSMYTAATVREQPLATWNPFNAKSLKRPPPDEIGVTQDIPAEEARQIFDRAEAAGPLGWRDVAILRLMYDTGLRISSAVAIERGRLFRRDDGQLVLRGVKVKKKGRVEVEIPEIAASAIDRWLSVAPDSHWLFPAARGGDHMQRRAFNKRLDVYAKAVGLKKVHPHRFRATFISDALDNMPLNDVQAAVHHADPKTTQKYDRHKRGAGVTAAVAKLRSDT
jgi:integrase